MTWLDYETPKPPERRDAFRALRHFAVGLALGILIDDIFEGQLAVMFCCGIYSTVAIGVFALVNSLRVTVNTGPLKERHWLLTVSSGTAIALIEYGILRWAENQPHLEGMWRVYEAWVIMPIICAFVVVKRR